MTDLKRIIVGHHAAHPPTDQVSFRILGEDDEFLGVDKPAGMLVHPTKPGGPRTLWDELRGLLGYEVATGGQVSLVNRLDRETSGVVVVAKTYAAARLAGMQLAAGEGQKVYSAAVFGWPEWEELHVDAPILRRGEIEPSAVYLERMVHPAGAPAATAFRVLERNTDARGPWSLLEARPVTGRTHQIRVHLAHVGFPILGDKLYACGSQHYLDFISCGWTPALEAALWIPYHALRCQRMSLAGRTWSC